MRLLRTKIRLSPTTPLLPISLRFRLPKKTSIVREAI